VTVLFGGRNAGASPINDTWEWNGTIWSLRTTASSPPPRFLHSMSYDSLRQRTVVFGGVDNQGGLLADTWEYDGVTWIQVSTTGPGPLQGAMMSFDSVRNQTVLFGGGTQGAVSSSTWVWNGTSWVVRSPAAAPTARQQGAMVFDPVRARIVLYGGAGNTPPTNFSDTWEWDGVNWVPASLIRGDGIWNPGARSSHAAAYDPFSERVVLFGGTDGSGCLGDAWSWNGEGWSRHLLTPTSPGPRSGLQVWRDDQTNRLLLFGGACGTTFNNDLWSLALPVYARHETYGQGCMGSLGMPTLLVDPATAPVIGTTLQLIYQNVPGTFIPAIAGFGYSRGSPFPLDLTSAGLPGCQLLHSLEVTGAVGAPNGTGRVTWSLPIPNSTNLLATDLFLQCLHLEVPGFARWASLSNGVGIRFGDR
jgi:hypothetical protein